MSNIDNHINDNEVLQQMTTPTTNFLHLQWEPIRRQMNYIDFLKYPRAERIKHCNFTEMRLKTGCTWESGKDAGSGNHKGKVGRPLKKRSQMNYARKHLKALMLDLYNIELLGLPKNAPVCHLCVNNSQSVVPCTSPYHTYFGSSQENNLDRTPHDRKKGGFSCSQKRGICPHCGVEGKGRSFSSHVKACRFNPESRNYLKPFRNDFGSRYTINNLEQQGLYTGPHRFLKWELEDLIIEKQKNIL